MQRIGKVAEKATGLVFDAYAVASESDPMKSYAVGVRNGYACRCTCRDRQYRPHKPCKHMKRLQAELDEQRRTAPLYREPFEMVKTAR